jgi:Smg protein
LSAVGFEAEEISEALSWLTGLQEMSSQTALEQSAHAIRVFSTAELDHLGAKALGFLQFLVSAGVLTARQREIVLDRVMAVSGDPVDLEDLKIIVLMLFWSLGKEPDALILDELFVEDEDRLIH